MRLPIAILIAVTALAACDVPQQPARDAMPCPAPKSASAYGAPRPAPDMDAQMICMKDAWAESKRELVEAKSVAVAENREMPPKVDAEVDEVLSRKVGGETDDARLEQLRDAVSDARRLAAIVSAG
ncbi:hypothetical protein ACSSVY_004051 [Roseovarius sp. MBR-51]